MVRGRRLLTTCAAGETNAHIIGSADYGASPNQCSEFCSMPFVLQYMAGVEEGSCASKGFPVPSGSATVQPPGSPQSMQVDIYDVDAVATQACHCHTYERIVCGQMGDMLYDEHINEITTHCDGIVSGTEDACPYLCFQPFEVLHLHYLECPTRMKDPMYLKVEATNLCHIGAAVPFGAPCDLVDVGNGTDEVVPIGMPEDWEDGAMPVRGEDGARPGCVSIPIALAMELQATACPQAAME